MSPTERLMNIAAGTRDFPVSATVRLAVLSELAPHLITAVPWRTVRGIARRIPPGLLQC